MRRSHRMLHSNSYNPIHLAVAAAGGAVVVVAAAVVAASVVAAEPRIHHSHHIPFVVAAVGEEEGILIHPSVDIHHTYLHTPAVAGTAADYVDTPVAGAVHTMPTHFAVEA